MSTESNQPESASFDTNEEAWFSHPQRTTRPSQRPTQPAPAMPAYLDDSIADGWFFDV